MRSKWTPDRMERAVTLWSDGVPEIEIAKKLGATRGAFASVVCYKRHLFPLRGKPKFTLPQLDAPKAEPEADSRDATRRTNIAGKWVYHVKRKTISGAIVTLPRISCIDGARDSG